jgi:hypothetical protein
MKKKPLIVFVDHGIVSGYKLPKDTEVCIVDLDTAKHEGQENNALRWMEQVSKGEDKFLVSDNLSWDSWYNA